MGAKVTWWPVIMATSMTRPEIVLMRYDWPDQRIYQVGLYEPNEFFRWTDGHGGMLQKPDYFTVIGNVLPFINIPPEEEYTYKVTRSGQDEQHADHGDDDKG